MNRPFASISAGHLPHRECATLTEAGEPSSPNQSEMYTRVLLDGRTLAYQCYGCPTGRPLYFFHGFPGSRLQAKLVHEQAATAGVCLIAPDRPGFGRSTYAPDRTILSWADDVAQLADALGHGHFSVLGVSCGGPYALACAHRLAKRLDYVGLVAGIGPMDVPSIRREQMRVLRLLFSLARIHPVLVAPFLFADRRLFRGDAKRAVQMLARMLTPPDRKLLATDTHLRTRFGASLAEAYVQGIAGAIREVQLIAGPRGFLLEHITCPVHLYQSGQDRHVPPAMGRYMAERIPNARLRIYPEEGHLSVLVHRFGDCLLDFLAACTNALA